jgi:hypothetical protein
MVIGVVVGYQKLLLTVVTQVHVVGYGRHVAYLDVDERFCRRYRLTSRRRQNCHVPVASSKPHGVLVTGIDVDDVKKTFDHDVSLMGTDVSF